MKKAGNICDFAQERDDAIMAAYRQELIQSRATSLDIIAVGVAARPCRRFWVSEERAVSVVSAMLRGKDVTSSMHPSKKRMFEEIYRRTMVLRARRPHASLISVIPEVIYSEAPEFYLSPRYIRDRIIITRNITEKRCRRIS
ncbi:MAG: hypothetical protein K2K37_05050 [Muribaculaceae bacterium]|nr:hypothetical protein [Muribaculaceae bacterium]